MNIRAVTTPWQSAEADWLIVFVPEGADFLGPLAEFDKASGGRLTRLREAGDLTGKQAELLAIRDVQPLPAKRLLVVGIGKPVDFTLPRFEKACLSAVRMSRKRNSRTSPSPHRSSRGRRQMSPSSSKSSPLRPPSAARDKASTKPNRRGFPSRN